MKFNDYNDLLNFFNLYELIQIKTGERIIPAMEDVGELKIPDYRYAETVEDYEFILNREAEKNNQNPEDYREVLLEDLQFMLEKDVTEFRESNTDLTDKRVRVKKLIKYLENRQQVEQANKNLEVFASDKGKRIFNEWFELHKDKIVKADFDFIFWALKKDEFLRIGTTQSIFTEWMSSHESGKLIFGRIQNEPKAFTNQIKRQSLYQITKERTK